MSEPHSQWAEAEWAAKEARQWLAATQPDNPSIIVQLGVGYALLSVAESMQANRNAAALDALAKVEAAVRAALVNDYAKAAILAAIEQVKRGYQP